MVLIFHIINYPDIFSFQCMPSVGNALIQYYVVSVKLNDFCKGHIFVKPWNSHDSFLP